MQTAISPTDAEAKAGAPGAAGQAGAPGAGGEGKAAAARGMSIGDMIRARRADQARIGLEAEVRETARGLGADRAQAEALAEASRVAFAIVNGEPQVLVAEGTHERT